jgi:Dolichyl-phosphate-mannose-protein mannosyltransferase
MKIKALRIKSYLLIAILIAAAILRFDQIDQPFIDATSWRQTDTASMAENFYRGNWNILYPQISWNGSEPNYVGYEFQTVTYIAAQLYRLVGQHDWVGRSVAAFFGLWSIFALYQLVRRVWDENHALASAAVLAILPGSVYVDRSFLPDPVMVSLVVTSFWLLVAYLQTERLHYLLLASLTGMWGFLTKISGIFVGIAMLYAILTILTRKRMLRSKQLALICVAAVVILIPVVAYYLWAIYISRTYPPYYIAAGSYWVWKYGLRQFLEQNYFLPTLYLQLSWFWTKPIIVLVVVSLLLRPPQCDRNSDPDQLVGDRVGKAPWLFHWWMLAFVIYYLIAAQGLVGNPTNLNIVNPAAAALTANALMQIALLTKRIAGSSASIALIAAILVIISGFGYHHWKLMYYPWAEDGYKLGLALRQISQPGDLVVAISNTIGDPVAIYYSHRRGWVFPPLTNWSLNWWDGIKDDREAIRLLEELRAKGADWFGIVNDQKNKIWQDNPKLVEYIERTFELSKASPEYIIYQIPSAHKRV